MKNIKKEWDQMILESRIKSLITQYGQNKSIKPNGFLNEYFIISYLVNNCKQASVEYRKLLQVFEEIKKDALPNNWHPKVRDEILDKYEFYDEAVVRPVY